MHNKLIEKINLLIPDIVPKHLNRNHYFAVALETIETGQEPREADLLSRDILDRLLTKIRMVKGCGVLYNRPNMILNLLTGYEEHQ